MLYSFQEAKMPQDDITKLLKEAGVEPVATDVKNVVNTLKGKSLNDVIKEGQKQLTNFSVGGGSSQSTAPTPQATSAAQTAPEPKVEPPKKAEEPEEDIDMGGLFD